jgi:hypothetical protein
MKKIIVLFLGLSLIFLSCHRDDIIIGIWERKEDAFSGMKVEVKKIGDVVNGAIIYSPSYATTSGFMVNDIKWKGIKKIEGKYYEFEDLEKAVDREGNIRTINYDLARLVIENDIIKIIMYTKGAEIIGTEQIWVKTK